MKTFRRAAVQVGARPGTLVLPAGSPSPRIRYVDYTADALVEGEVRDVEELREIHERDSVTWVDVQGLGDEETLRQVQRIFGLHDLVLEDLANVPQRPSADEIEGHVVVVTRMLRLQGDDLDREQLSLVLGPNYVLTFQERYGDVLDPVRERLRRGKGTLRKAGADYLLYALVDTVVDGFLPILEEIGDRLEALEEIVLDRPVPETLRRINRVRGHLLILRRLLWPIRESAGRLCREEEALVDERARLYLRDTYDHCQQAAEFVETFREMASGLMNTYLSAAGNRMNEIMKVLTIMASIFIPLTFMAGIYGMNFEAMPELRFRWAYPALLVLMVVTAAAMLLHFRRRGWIGDDPDRG
ncbi:MAG: magnesium/cobalt transporter CorA [Planctomycetota bacterium JB042]